MALTTMLWLKWHFFIFQIKRVVHFPCQYYINVWYNRALNEAFDNVLWKITSNYSFLIILWYTRIYMWYTKKLSDCIKCVAKCFRVFLIYILRVLMLMLVFALHDFPSGFKTIHQRICPLRKIIKRRVYTVVIFFYGFHICDYLEWIAIDVFIWYRFCCFVK